MESSLYSSHDLSEITIPKKGLTITRITIDMTGWSDGTRPDKSAVDRGTFPYSIEFTDGDGKLVQMMSGELKADGMRELMEQAEYMNILPASGTRVEVICPGESIETYRTAGKQPYGAHFHCGLEQFNEYGLGALTFDPKKGLCEKRLESVMDQVVHTWAINEKSREVHRYAPFSKSVYHYRDRDNDVLDGHLPNHSMQQTGSDFGDRG